MQDYMTHMQETSEHIFDIAIDQLDDKSAYPCTGTENLSPLTQSTQNLMNGV